ncbi:tetratricopeptide repeat protein [Candidatus Pelagibacter sp. HIMB1321]|uniref:tetratricopeptide repeat protein n=1 Tax=Candidatus Pelagibacter sp. HIMB1321 TaxID=1388755 RepID=UPI000A081B63|nr:tetratricopeptide repeat protein [Candidatus Pelagibacter sp. HIMB1321]SMF78283.1 Putative negative regulator of RcsB-dependent stress response [Candidatus Pelagibacter sp. HIMB1321]
MDEETAIINSNTRNEKIRNFFVNNKKTLLTFVVIIIAILFGYFANEEYKENKKLEISDQYNSAVTKYSEENKEITKNSLVDLVYKNDSTYSPLSLYFIIDNKLITGKSEINDLFDNIIEEVSLDKEIKNLIIYKKALYNADSSEENELLEILKPITNSESIWKAQALYLIAEYFYSKDEKQKSKEFFNQIILIDNANQYLKTEAQKRLNRDLSE